MILFFLLMKTYTILLRTRSFSLKTFLLEKETLFLTLGLDVEYLAYSLLKGRDGLSQPT